MRKEGLISSFGGPLDMGMGRTEGTSFYEAWEAAKRPDLFSPPSYEGQGLGHRLRNKEAFYIALNVPNCVDRNDVHKSIWVITNVNNGYSCKAHLVDRGPGAAGRLVDASDALLSYIKAKTDDLVRVEEVTNFGIKFGLYDEMMRAEGK